MDIYSIIQIILGSLYFFVPAYVANMTPPIVKWLNIANPLAKPIDGGRQFLGKPLFGDHKTWRGLILGTFAGICAYCLQISLAHFSFFQSIQLIDYLDPKNNIFAVILPLGGLLGDLFFSFIKRRTNLEPGASFLFFDQTNYVLGAWVMVKIFTPHSVADNFTIWLTLILLTLILHIIVNRIGYSLKIHKAKW